MFIKKQKCIPFVFTLNKKKKKEKRKKERKEKKKIKIRLNFERNMRKMKFYCDHNYL